MPSQLIATLVLALALRAACGAIIDFEADAGGVPDDDATAVAWGNTEALNRTLATLAPGDTLLVPNKTYVFMGGVAASGLADVTLQLDGTLKLSDNQDAYPVGDDGFPVDAILLEDLANVTLTSGDVGSMQVTQR